MGLLGAKSIVNKLGWVAAPTMLAAVGILDGSPSSPPPSSLPGPHGPLPTSLQGTKPQEGVGTHSRPAEGPRAAPLDHLVCSTLSHWALHSVLPQGQELTVRRECPVPKAQRHSAKNQVASLGSEVKNLLANKTQVLWKPRFDSWVGKIPWRRKWSPVFLPGEFHGQRSLLGSQKVRND